MEYKDTGYALVVSHVPTRDDTKEGYVGCTPKTLWCKWMYSGQGAGQLCWLCTNYDHHFWQALCSQDDGDDLEPNALPIHVNLPTREELETRGEHKLVQAILAAGGFTTVAHKLGFRTKRRPNGFWEDINSLDEVLTSTPSLSMWRWWGLGFRCKWTWQGHHRQTSTHLSAGGTNFCLSSVGGDLES